jgi:hypothetical protein
MAEKVACARCGTPILTTTAAKNSGLCMPCSRGDRWALCEDCGIPILKAPSTDRYAALCLICLGKRERLRPTSIDAFVQQYGDGDCTLLTALYKLDERLRRQQRDAWIGLNLIDPPHRYESSATPINTIAFAETGGDFVHFSLVTSNGKVSDECPVVVTIPSSLDSVWEQNFIVGESLQEFLCLGCVAGYDLFEELNVEDWSEVAAQLAIPPDDKEAKEALGQLRRELKLKPMRDIERKLRDLDDGKRSMLQFD